MAAQKCDCCTPIKHREARDAVVDCKSKFGWWAYMCEDCWNEFGNKKKGLYTTLASSGARQ